MAVVGQYDASHGVQQHLQHGLGTQTGSDDVGDTRGVGGQNRRSLFGGRSTGWDGNQTYILAAVMLDSWAFRPVCRSPLAVSIESCASAWQSPPDALESSTGASWWGGRPTHNQHGGLHLDSFATVCAWIGIKGVYRSNQGVTIASLVLERQKMLARHCVKGSRLADLFTFCAPRSLNLHAQVTR